MRVVIGGAHNGKRKYVEDQLVNMPPEKCHFFNGELPKNGSFMKDDVIIIRHFERIVEKCLDLDEVQIAENIFQEIQLLDLHGNVICICTDIGRGIVPIQKENRKIRDTCGRLYQKLFAHSESVVRVWYGIPKQLKGEG